MNKDLDRDERFSPPPVGGISLMAAFAVLCLTVFALLSLIMVQAQGRLADASFQTVAGYYRADCEALRILALLREGDIPENVTLNNDIYTYECLVSESQNLKIEVRLSGEDYEILCWQAVPKEQDTGDAGLDLWDGEF